MNYGKVCAALIGTAALFGSAHAATFYLGGSDATLGKSAGFTSGSASLTATAINTEEPEAPVLTRNIFGLGVYTGEGSDDHLGGGQLDNIHDDEAIVLDFGAAANLDSITLSVASFFDDIQIYGSNEASVAAITSGGLASITAVSTLLESSSGNGLEGFETIDLSGIASAYRYLVATIPGGSGDGFRVKWVTADVQEIPLPAALPLMLAGLAGLGFASRGRRKTA